MQLTCIICCELFGTDDETGVTKCGHLFHLHCAVPLIKKNQECPQCHQYCSSNLLKVFLIESDDDNYCGSVTKANSNIVDKNVENLSVSIELIKINETNQIIDENKSLKINLEKYENKIIDLKTIIKTLEENIETITAERDELNEQLDEFQSNFESIDDIWTLKMELESLTIENENIKTELFSLEDTNRRIESENNRNEEELSFQLQELSSQVRNLEDENENLKTKISVLENTNYHHY